LTYHREQAAARPGLSPDDPVNFVMSTLVDFADPGLIILAPHRVIKGLTQAVLAELNTSWPLILRSPITRERQKYLEKTGCRDGQTDGIRLGYFGPGTDKFYGLKLRDEKVLAQIMPSQSDIYRKLDVSVLDM